jgi:hypothetical protein
MGQLHFQHVQPHRDADDAVVVVDVDADGAAAPLHVLEVGSATQSRLHLKPVYRFMRFKA